MASECLTGINIPILAENPCPSGTVGTKCVLTQTPITYFNLPIGTQQEVVNTNLIASLADTRARVNSLESNLNPSVVNNTTPTLLTLLQLNTQYPLATIGFEVQCLTILRVYKKSTLGWINYPITITL
jgi:hypothetical protein